MLVCLAAQNQALRTAVVGHASTTTVSAAVRCPQRPASPRQQPGADRTGAVLGHPLDQHRLRPTGQVQQTSAPDCGASRHLARNEADDTW
jgi:hypothetical protein